MNQYQLWLRYNKKRLAFPWPLRTITPKIDNPSESDKTEEAMRTEDHENPLPSRSSALPKDFESKGITPSAKKEGFFDKIGRVAGNVSNSVGSMFQKIRSNNFDRKKRTGMGEIHSGEVYSSNLDESAAREGKTIYQKGKEEQDERFLRPKAIGHIKQLIDEAENNSPGSTGHIKHPEELLNDTASAFHVLSAAHKHHVGQSKKLKGISEVIHNTLGSNLPAFQAAYKRTGAVPLPKPIKKTLVKQLKGYLGQLHSSPSSNRLLHRLHIERIAKHLDSASDIDLITLAKKLR